MIMTGAVRFDWKFNQ